MENSLFYIECRTLIQQWRYEELQKFIERIRPADSEYWTGQYVLLESHLAYANFEAAEQCFFHAEKNLPPLHPLFTSFSLRYSFLLLQTYRAEDMYDALRRFEHVYEEPDTSTYNKALALTQYGRSLLLGMSFGMLPATEKKTAQRFLYNAAILFREHGFVQDYHSTLLLQGETARKKPNPNPTDAERLFRQLLDSATLYSDEISGSQATLALAELAFEKEYRPDITEKDWLQLIGAFEEPTEQLKRGWHLTGDAIINSHLGDLLLRFSIEDGLNYLEKAYTGFAVNRFFAQAQGMLRAIALWHLNHGNGKENNDYEQRASQLDSVINISLGNKISYLGKIEQAHRTGDIGAARLLYVEASEDFAEHPLRNQFDTLHASNLSKAGLTEESIHIYRKILEHVKRLEVSSFLSDAYTNLAANLIHIDSGEAALYIKRAIEIDELVEDSLVKVQHIQIFIQILAEQSKQSFGLPLQIPPSIDVYLEECRKLLHNNYTLEAWIRHGEIFQLRGYLLFSANRLDEALLAYQQAENLFRELHLNNHLSFLTSHQGLMLVDKARQTSSVLLFDCAKTSFQKALALFEMGLQKAEQASMLGMLGICDYEAGRLEKPEIAAIRWTQAETWFESSYQINRYLRIHTDHSSAFSQQQSMIAFGRQNLTYPTQAFYMHYGYTQQTRPAIKWLERVKSQALTEAMVARYNFKSNDEWLAQNTFVNQLDAFSDVVQKVQEALPDTPCLILQYFCLARHVIVYAIRKERKEPKVYTLPVLYTELTDCAELYFSSQYGTVRSMMDNDLEEQWQLFRTLIQPVEDWSSPGDLVYLVPHSVLHRFPMHTLKLSNGQYLIERNPVSYSPSLSVLTFQAVNLNEPAKAKVFGDSRNNLPFAREEAITIAQLLGVEPCLYNDVTKEKVLSSLAHYKILHICCHGELVGSDGWQYGMQMADRQTLTAGDVFPLRTMADLVVLSGCETGVSEYTEGDELTGLIRAFLHAGVRNLIVSQWQVDDAATADLFAAFYSRLIEAPQISKTVALQQAICQMKETGRHFYYWGGFQIFGQLN